MESIKPDELIRAFLGGATDMRTGTKKNPGPLRIMNDKLICFQTVICERFGDKFIINPQFYSQKTEIVQNILLRLIPKDRQILTTGVPFIYWGSLKEYIVDEMENNVYPKEVNIEAEVLEDTPIAHNFSTGDILTIIKTDSSMASEDSPRNVVLFSQDENDNCKVFLISPRKAKNSIPIQIRYNSKFTRSCFAQCSKLLTIKKSDLELCNGYSVDDTENTIHRIESMYRYLNPQKTDVSTSHEHLQSHPEKQENKNRIVLTFTNLVLINALDDFQQAY